MLSLTCFALLGIGLLTQLELLSAASVASSPLTVNLSSGSFRGVSSASNGTERWLGIPFAEPPLGKLRFKAPVPVKAKSKKVQDASNFGDACPQLPSATLGAAMSEDCLNLNVSQVCLYLDTIFTFAERFGGRLGPPPRMNCLSSYGST